MLPVRRLRIIHWSTHTEVRLTGDNVNFELRVFRHRNREAHAVSYASRLGDLLGLDMEVERP